MLEPESLVFHLKGFMRSWLFTVIFSDTRGTYSYHGRLVIMSKIIRCSPRSFASLRLFTCRVEVRLLRSIIFEYANH